MVQKGRDMLTCGICGKLISRGAVGSLDWRPFWFLGRWWTVCPRHYPAQPARAEAMAEAQRRVFITLTRREFISRH